MIGKMATLQACLICIHVPYTARTDDVEYVKMEVWHAPNLSKPTFKEAVRAKYKPLKKGDTFGPSWTNHWVCLRTKCLFNGSTKGVIRFGYTCLYQKNIRKRSEYSWSSIQGDKRLQSQIRNTQICFKLRSHGL